MEALIVVDVQNDFCPGGALPVADGDAVVEPVNRLAEQMPFVIATRDWHPSDHSSFAQYGGPWPAHCVHDTPGAQLHPAIDPGRIDVVLDKGQMREQEGYSAFEETALAGLLRDRDIDTVHVVGLALDYCVKATALDAIKAGFQVVVHLAATRAVEVQPGDSQRAQDDLRLAGVQLIR